MTLNIIDNKTNTNLNENQTTCSKNKRIINVTHQVPFEIHNSNGGIKVSNSSSNNNSSDSNINNKCTWFFKARRGHNAMYGGVHSYKLSMGYFTYWLDRANYLGTRK
ncbi:unnamed protein product [Cunninghamella blakesleeana]